MKFKKGHRKRSLCEKSSEGLVSSLTHCIIRLIDNSINAKSTCVAVRVNPKLFDIQLVDNGSGIGASVLKDIGNRYSARHDQYLSNGGTIVSISDICSKIIIVSKPGTDTDTYCKVLGYDYKGPRQVLKALHDRKCKGTTIIIKNLFCNNPVRQKITSTSFEIRNIEKYVRALALINPRIAFTLRDDITMRQLLNTKRSTSLREAFQLSFPSAVKYDNSFVEIKCESSTMKCHALFCKETVTSNQLQIVFVNGKLIKKNYIHKQIKQLLGGCFYFSSIFKKIIPFRGHVHSPVSKNKRYVAFVIHLRCSPKYFNTCYSDEAYLIDFYDWTPITTILEKVTNSFLSTCELKPSSKHSQRKTASDIKQRKSSRDKRIKHFDIVDSRTVFGLQVKRKNFEGNRNNEFPKVGDYSIRENKRENYENVSEDASNSVGLFNVRPLNNEQPTDLAANDCNEIRVTSLRYSITNDFDKEKNEKEESGKKLNKSSAELNNIEIVKRKNSNDSKAVKHKASTSKSHLRSKGVKMANISSAFAAMEVPNSKVGRSFLEPKNVLVAKNSLEITSCGNTKISGASKLKKVYKASYDKRHRDAMKLRETNLLNYEHSNDVNGKLNHSLASVSSKNNVNLRRIPKIVDSNSKIDKLNYRASRLTRRNPISQSKSVTVKLDNNTAKPSKVLRKSKFDIFQKLSSDINLLAHSRISDVKKGRSKNELPNNQVDNSTIGNSSNNKILGPISAKVCRSNYKVETSFESLLNSMNNRDRFSRKLIQINRETPKNNIPGGEVWNKHLRIAKEGNIDSDVKNYRKTVTNRRNHSITKGKENCADKLNNRESEKIQKKNPKRVEIFKSLKRPVILSKSPSDNLKDIITSSGNNQDNCGNSETSGISEEIKNPSSKSICALELACKIKSKDVNSNFATLVKQLDSEFKKDSFNVTKLKPLSPTVEFDSVKFWMNVDATSRQNLDGNAKEMGLLEDTTFTNVTGGNTQITRIANLREPYETDLSKRNLMNTIAGTTQITEIADSRDSDKSDLCKRNNVVDVAPTAQVADLGYSNQNNLFERNVLTDTPASARQVIRIADLLDPEKNNSTKSNILVDATGGTTKITQIAHFHNSYLSASDCNNDKSPSILTEHFSFFSSIDKNEKISPNIFTERVSPPIFNHKESFANLNKSPRWTKLRKKFHFSKGENNPAISIIQLNGCRFKNFRDSHKQLSTPNIISKLSPIKSIKLIRRNQRRKNFSIFRKCVNDADQINLNFIVNNAKVDGALSNSQESLPNVTANKIVDKAISSISQSADVLSMFKLLRRNYQFLKYLDKSTLLQIIERLCCLPSLKYDDFPSCHEFRSPKIGFRNSISHDAPSILVTRNSHHNNTSVATTQNIEPEMFKNPSDFSMEINKKSRIFHLKTPLLIGDSKNGQTPADISAIYPTGKNYLSSVIHNHLKLKNSIEESMDWVADDKGCHLRVDLLQHGQCRFNTPPFEGDPISSENATDSLILESKIANCMRGQFPHSYGGNVPENLKKILNKDSFVFQNDASNLENNISLLVSESEVINTNSLQNVANTRKSENESSSESRIPNNDPLLLQNREKLQNVFDSSILKLQTSGNFSGSDPGKINESLIDSSVSKFQVPEFNLSPSPNEICKKSSNNVSNSRDSESLISSFNSSPGPNLINGTLTKDLIESSDSQPQIPKYDLSPRQNEIDGRSVKDGMESSVLQISEFSSSPRPNMIGEQSLINEVESSVLESHVSEFNSSTPSPNKFTSATFKGVIDSSISQSKISEYNSTPPPRDVNGISPQVLNVSQYFQNGIVCPLTPTAINEKHDEISHSPSALLNLVDHRASWTQWENYVNGLFSPVMIEKPDEWTFDIRSRNSFIPKGSSPLLELRNSTPAILPEPEKIVLREAINSFKSKEQIFTDEFGSSCIQMVGKQIINSTIDKRNQEYSVRNGSVVLTKSDLNNIRFMTQLSNKFILATVTTPNSNLIIAIDQHAIDERRRLEQLLCDYKEANGEWRSVPINPTVELVINDSAQSLLENRPDVLRNLGLIIKKKRSTSGKSDSIIVTDVPAVIRNKVLKETSVHMASMAEALIVSLIQEIVDYVSQCPLNATHFFPHTLRELVNSEACRNAVKFGDKLSNEQCVVMLQRLKDCALPFQCAHGRPSIAPLIDLKHYS